MNINRVVLVGRLGADPELRYTAGGTAVTDLRLAVSEKFKDKSGEVQEKTVWIAATCWGAQAELACQYLTKGQEVGVEGRLDEETWDDKNTGEKRSKIKVTADKVHFGAKPKAKDEHQ